MPGVIPDKVKIKQNDSEFSSGTSTGSKNQKGANNSKGGHRRTIAGRIHQNDVAGNQIENTIVKVQYPVQPGQQPMNNRPKSRSRQLTNIPASQIDRKGANMTKQTKN